MYRKPWSISRWAACFYAESPILELSNGLSALYGVSLLRSQALVDGHLSLVLRVVDVRRAVATPFLREAGLLPSLQIRANFLTRQGMRCVIDVGRMYRASESRNEKHGSK